MNVRSFHIFLIFLFSFSANAAQTFELVSKKSEVVFISEAPMEKVSGTTKAVSGFISADPRNLATAKASFEIEAASFKTGNRLRDKHMREKFLHTNKFPKILFTLTKIEGANSIEVGQSKSLKGRGALTLHGVRHSIQVPLEVRFEKKGELRVSSKFQFKLSDYKIERPKFLFLRLAEEVDIEVNLQLESRE